MRDTGQGITSQKRRVDPMSGDKKTGSMLRSRDVAHILGCSSDDVIELACKGELKAEKQGRVWRFREEDLRAYLEKTAKRPESPTDLGKTPMKFGFLSRPSWTSFFLRSFCSRSSRSFGGHYRRTPGSIPDPE